MNSDNYYCILLAKCNKFQSNEFASRFLKFEIIEILILICGVIKSLSFEYILLIVLFIFSFTFFFWKTADHSSDSSHAITTSF